MLTAGVHISTMTLQESVGEKLTLNRAKPIEKNVAYNTSHRRWHPAY